MSAYRDRADGGAFEVGELDMEEEPGFYWWQCYTDGTPDLSETASVHGPFKDYQEAYNDAMEES